MAIAFDATSTSGEITSGSSLSWSHTCTGSNLILLVGVSIDSNPFPTVSGITYNGVALTKIRSDSDNTNFISTDLWYLIGPSAGAHTIAVTLSANIGNSAVGTAVSLTGAKQSAQPDAHNGGIGSASPASISVTTVADGAWLVDCLQLNANNAATPGGSQTQRQQVAEINAGGRAAMSTLGPVSPPAATTDSWTFTTTQWTLGVASIAPAAAGPFPDSWHRPFSEPVQEIPKVEAY